MDTCVEQKERQRIQTIRAYKTCKTRIYKHVQNAKLPNGNTRAPNK